LKQLYILALGLASACASAAAPTGLNVIPTTDIVPDGSWIGGIVNGNTSLTGNPFYRQPQWQFQSQVSLAPWLEGGIDDATTPDVDSNTGVFNVKALVMTENEWQPNVALGLWNVADHQKPGYYLTMSKTLNYDQQQEERFRAHHRRNRKLLGIRAHLGMTLDGRGFTQPFTGTDIQLSETAVFQADWVHGSGNVATAGIAYIFPDGRTVLTPAITFSNDTGRFNGLIIGLTHQFNL